MIHDSESLKRLTRKRLEETADEYGVRHNKDMKPAAIRALILERIEKDKKKVIVADGESLDDMFSSAEDLPDDIIEESIQDEEKDEAEAEQETVQDEEIISDGVQDEGDVDQDEAEQVSVVHANPVEDEAKENPFLDIILKGIASRSLPEVNPGVVMIKEDTGGVLRPVVGVTHATFNLIVDAYVDDSINVNMLDFDNIDPYYRKEIGLVLYNYEKSGRAYIRCNSTSKFYYL